MHPHQPPRQTGAALLLAMLTVALVATFAGAAVWQQWRTTEIETAERARLQSAWILGGAMDWSRLILREDARLGGADTLSEPWAVPLMEARLSTFLAAERNITIDAGHLPEDAFLSGRIEDLQGRFNLGNLMQGRQLSATDAQVLRRLFSTLRLPASAAEQLISQWQRAALASLAAGDADPAAPILPSRVAQLAWLGLEPELVRQLTPYVAILPKRTTINANTAAAEVLMAAAPHVSQGEIMRLVAARTSKPFADLEALHQAIAPGAGQAQLGISSQYFLVHGSLRVGNIRIGEQALVWRDGQDMRMLWREKGNMLTLDAAASQRP